MKRIYVVKGGPVVNRLAGSRTPINSSSGKTDVVPGDVRRFPLALTAAANDMNMLVEAPNKGEGPCA